MNIDLFDQHRQEMHKKNAPLADRMRPRTLDEFIGQDHIVGPGRLLRRAIQIDQLSSLIFYGPPGTGKTTLARIIANTTKADFISINAVLAGVKDIREAIDRAGKTLSLYGKRTILFVDEVHRFNKAQQDALLPHVENGLLILIGATTENPYFEVNKALVSRSRIFQLKTLTEDDLRNVAHQALRDKERGYGSKSVTIDNDALEHLVHVANGDARGVLNALELAVETTQAASDGGIHITREEAEESIQQRAVLYDKDGDAHYDTISAFIKSIRGSDPDAALYWMAKMLYAGEDPRFIFRRLIILASEDIGLADSDALGVVMHAAQAFDYVGLPEGRFHLAQACLYLSTAPKSNSTLAFFDAINMVAKERDDDVPNHLRDASRDKDGFGHGEGYLYPHAYRDHWVAQQYLPDVMQGRTFYDPSDQGFEKSIRHDVSRRREAQIEAMVETTSDSIFGENTFENKDTTQWAKRTSGNAGNRLAELRDRIFELASLKKDSLVLDIYGTTGLLTFEAARRVDDGGVWSLAHDGKSHETLSSTANRLPPLERPQIVRTNFDDFEKDIEQDAGSKVRFDRVIGRNALSKVGDKHLLLKRLAHLLRPNGIIILADTIHSASQRISDLLTLPNARMKKKFGKVEEELLTEPSNPATNWKPAELVQTMKNGSRGISIRVQEVTHTGIRRISPQDVAFWFRQSQTKLPSLGDRLRDTFSETDVNKINIAMLNQLINRDVDWKYTVAYFIIAGTSQNEVRV